MSAWIVDKRHIDVLVAAAEQLEISLKPFGFSASAPGKLRDELGAMLWAENHASVNARYREDTETPPYSFEPVRVEALSFAVVMKAIGCYCYQSCEHDGWETSNARAFCQALGCSVAESYASKMPEYTAAPWGIEPGHVAFNVPARWAAED